MIGLSKYLPFPLFFEQILSNYLNSLQFDNKMKEDIKKFNISVSKKTKRCGFARGTILFKTPNSFPNS